MKAVPNTYFDSETNEQTRLEADILRSFPGATVSSGIEREISELPSPSMTQYSEPVVISIYDQVDKEGSTERIPYKTVLLLPDLEGLEYSGLYTVRQLPEGVREQLRNLCQQESEAEQYEIADTITEWMTDASGTEQATLAPELHELRHQDIRVLLSALADSEVRLRSERLLHTIAGLLGSDDKRLAQASALCLLQCGGVLGGTLLRFRLANPASLPHINLILGAINLLTSR